MFLIYNYNGGPEIILSKNNDIYTSFVSCSDKMITCYNNYNTNLNSSKLVNSSALDFTEEDESKLDIDEENQEIKSNSKNEIFQIQQQNDNKFIK